MKTLFIIALMFLPLTKVFAHEEGTEVTDIAEADWVGPLVAIVVIITAIIIARIIRSRSKTQIINSKEV